MTHSSGPIVVATWSISDGRLVTYDRGFATLLHFHPAELAHSLFVSQILKDTSVERQLETYKIYLSCCLVCQDGDTAMADLHCIRGDVWVWVLYRTAGAAVLPVRATTSSLLYDLLPLQSYVSLGHLVDQTTSMTRTPIRHRQAPQKEGLELCMLKRQRCKGSARSDPIFTPAVATLVCHRVPTTT